MRNVSNVSWPSEEAQLARHLESLHFRLPATQDTFIKIAHLPRVPIDGELALVLDAVKVLAYFMLVFCLVWKRMESRISVRRLVASQMMVVVAMMMIGASLVLDLFADGEMKSPHILLHTSLHLLVLFFPVKIRSRLSVPQPHRPDAHQHYTFLILSATISTATALTATFKGLDSVCFAIGLTGCGYFGLLYLKLALISVNAASFWIVDHDEVLGEYVFNKEENRWVPRFHADGDMIFMNIVF